MNPTASRNLFKPLPALREPVSGPKSKKNVKKGKGKGPEVDGDDSGKGKGKGKGKGSKGS